MNLKCPDCGNEDQAQMLGHVEYDRVLWWECMACGRAFPRDFGDWERLNEESRQRVEEHNAGGARTAPQEGK